MLKSAVLLAVSVAACLALGAGSAHAGSAHRVVAASPASRPAHSGERRAIARAIRRSRFTQGVRGKFDVVHVRISTVDRHWGTARLRPKPRYRNQLDTATAVVHRAHSRWRLRTLGTADVGCVIHRRAVRRDLQLQCSG